MRTNTVVVIEFDSNIRSVVREILEGEGYHVIAVKSAEDGIEVLRNGYSNPDDEVYGYEKAILGV